MFEDYTDDETPTSPNNPKPDPELMGLLKLYSCFSTVERRRFVRMARNWYNSSTDRQVLIEEMAREFSGPIVTFG